MIGCTYCNEPIDKRRKDARFCSDACKQAAYRDRLVTNRNKNIHVSVTRNANLRVGTDKMPEFPDQLGSNSGKCVPPESKVERVDGDRT